MNRRSDKMDNEMKGVLFKNDRKESESQPLYKGKSTIKGVEYYVSAWVNTSKIGNKYMSLKYTAVDEKIQEAKENLEESKDHIQDDSQFVDDIPF
jgi:hypothetical protein